MMRKLDREEVILNANKYGLNPVRVRNREVVQLSRTSSGKFVGITWDEFFEVLDKKRLAVYMSRSGYMKIMSDDVYD